MYSSTATSSSASPVVFRALLLSDESRGKDSLDIPLEKLRLASFTPPLQECAFRSSQPPANLEVDSVPDLEQALRTIDTSRELPARFSLIILDGSVLRGRDVQSVVNRIQSVQPDLSIVIHNFTGQETLADASGSQGTVLTFRSSLNGAELTQIMQLMHDSWRKRAEVSVNQHSAPSTDPLSTLESPDSRLKDYQEHCRWLEDQLRQTHRLATLGRLTDGVTHYFNNRITVIQGHLSLALASTGQNTEITAQLQQLLNATKEIASMTSQLVAYNHREYLKPQPVRLDKIIDTELVMLRKTLGEQIDLYVSHDESLPTVLADPSCLAHIVLSLALHARDAMPKGGRITIETRGVSITSDDAAKRLHPEARPGVFVRMMIGDTGTPMAADEISKLLSPSILASKKGRDCDVGLLLIQGLVRQQGGWLNAVSSPENGNEFTIHLPVTSNEALAPQPPLESSRNNSGPHGPATVLIVEDDESVRGIMEYVLTSQGHKVIMAKDATEGWTQWRQNSLMIKLAIVDIKLPGGCSGFDLERALTEEDPTLPVVFTCGYNQTLLGATKDLKVGENYLPKPFGMKDLLEIVTHGLQRPASFR